MDNNKYPRIFTISSWWVVLYTVVFFTAINVVVAWVFKNNFAVAERLHSQASYQEIKEVITRINQDPRHKIVFLGGSVMWGGQGIDKAEDAIPLQFKKYVADGVAVYDLAYGAARPLDQFIILTQLKNVDLFVTDVNSNFHVAAYNQGIKEDYSKYIRVQSLLNNNRDDLFAKSPAAAVCLKKMGITPVQDRTSVLADQLPLVHYKDEINYRLFGKHFALAAEYLLNGLVNIFKTGPQGFEWSKVLAPTGEAFDPRENTTVFTTMPEALHPTLNSCIDQAFSEYVHRTKSPVLFYVSPHSPLMTKLQRQDPVYNQNVAFMSSLFEKNFFVNFDATTTTPPVPAEGFVDEVHLNAIGHTALVNQLVKIIKGSEKYNQLLK